MSVFKIFEKLLFGVFFTFVLVNISCVLTKSSAVREVAAPRAAASTPPAGTSIATSPTPAPTGIKLIDFGNFVYPWYPKHLSAPSGKREMVLRDKAFEVPMGNKEGLTPLRVDLEHVYYADLTSDGEEEAIVYLAGSI